MGKLRLLRTGAWGVGALAIAAVVAAHAAADAPDPGLSRQIRQLRHELRRAVPEERQPEIEARLARADTAAAARRYYLALYELEGAFETTRAFAFVEKSSGVKSVAEFSARWKAVGEPVAATAPRRPPLPAAVDALAASADSRAPAIFRASLPYGQDADVLSGLYYLGESQAVRAFAAFARSLAWPSAGTAPPMRSIAPELDALDDEVTKAYERMSRAQHPAYVLTSVTLKRARMLDSAGLYGGALLEYLLARFRFAALRPGPSPEPPGAARLADARSALEGNVDHSIGRLFVEMAEAALASDDPGVRRTAAVVIGDVLPAYHAALATARSRAGTAGAPAVTITLVRWPFT